MQVQDGPKEGGAGWALPSWGSPGTWKEAASCSDPCWQQVAAASSSPSQSIPVWTPSLYWKLVNQMQRSVKCIYLQHFNSHHDGKCMDVKLKGNPWWHSVVNTFIGFSDCRESRLFQLTDDIKLEGILMDWTWGTERSGWARQMSPNQQWNSTGNIKPLIDWKMSCNMQDKGKIWFYRKRSGGENSENWRQCNCSLTRGWLHNLWLSHSMEYYTFSKKSKLEVYISTRKYLKGILLNEKLPQKRIM